MSNRIFEPNYEKECITCEQTPVVEIPKDDPGNGNLCGPCYFGTAEALDPDMWEDC